MEGPLRRPWTRAWITLHHASLQASSPLKHTGLRTGKCPKSPTRIREDPFFLSQCYDKRKNWLFTGSERAGKRAAAIQSLLYTARLNGLDPAAWLRDTLEKLPTCPNSQIDSLLPLRAEALHHPSQ